MISVKDKFFCAILSRYTQPNEKEFNGFIARLPEDVNKKCLGDEGTLEAIDLTTAAPPTSGVIDEGLFRVSTISVIRSSSVFLMMPLANNPYQLYFLHFCICDDYIRLFMQYATCCVHYIFVVEKLSKRIVCVA